MCLKNIREYIMSKNKINEQTEKLKNLVGSARLQTSTQIAAKNDAAQGSDEISNEDKDLKSSARLQNVLNL